jgi:hypothetical protein
MFLHQIFTSFFYPVKKQGGIKTNKGIAGLAVTPLPVNVWG